MQKRPLGKTGLDISPIVFGGNVFGWTADETTSFRLLDKMVEGGINTIDTADVYSRWVEGHKGGESEQVIGDWLAANPGKRDRVVLISKVGGDMGEGKGLGRDWIETEVNKSLSRLKTDYLDLYFSHFPDPDTAHDETLAVYDKLLKEGKIRSIGASNFSREQLEAAAEAAHAGGLPEYQVIQPEYNLYTRSELEGPLQDYALQKEMGVITYFSLAAGFLTGKYRSKEDVTGDRAGRVGDYLDDRGMKILAGLDEVAERTGAKQAEIAIAWARQKPWVTAPIASATSDSQLETLHKAAELELDDEAMRRLDEAVN